MMQRIGKYFIYSSATLLLALVMVAGAPQSEAVASAHDDGFTGARTGGMLFAVLESPSGGRPAERPINEGVIESQDITGEDGDAAPVDHALPEPPALPEKSGPASIKVKEVIPVEKPLIAKPVPAKAVPPVQEAVEAAPVKKPVEEKPPTAPESGPASRKVKEVTPVDKPLVAKPVPAKAVPPVQEAVEAAPGSEALPVKAENPSNPDKPVIAAPKLVPALQSPVNAAEQKKPSEATDIVKAVKETSEEPSKDKTGKGKYNGPIDIRVKLLYGFDAKLSGIPLGWVDQIYIDDINDEIYLLDKNSKRIVVTNIAGGYLFHFNYLLAGIKNPTAFTVDILSGEIYLSNTKRIAILNYRGEFQGDFNLSQVPGNKTISIQSLYLVKGNDGDLLYVGDNKNRRILVFTTGGKYIRTIGGDRWVGDNIKGLYVNKDTVFWLDSTGFSVKSIGLDGKNKMFFGRLSSLLGGFSMPATLTVDDVNKRILVVDANRMMVIFFDYDGNTLFEFGGPRLFSWPRAVAVDKRGRVFVSDNKGVIRVFNVIALKPSGE